jgi:hypothetical protein
MKKNIYKIIITLLFLSPYFSYSQEYSNEKYNKITIMDGEKKGWLSVFSDPTQFGCECNDVISLEFKPTKIKNVYKSIDNTVTLTMKGNAYIVSIQGTKECCFIKPGKYTR